LPNQGANCKVSHMKADLAEAGTYDVDFVYDASGRLIKVINDGDAETYTYSADKVERIGLDENDRSTITLTNGRATSSFTNSFVEVNGWVYDLVGKYFYNTEGYLIKVEYYIDDELNSVNEFTYDKGNLVKCVNTLQINKSVTVTTYEYSDDLARQVFEAFDPLATFVEYCPGDYFGKPSKNVIKKSKTVTSSSAGEVWDEEVIDYSHKLDKNKNTTAIVMNSVYTSYQSGGDPEPYSYVAKFDFTYNCK
jgi:hypothetical protein